MKFASHCVALFFLIAASAQVSAAKLDLNTPCDLDKPSVGPAFQGHSVDAVFALLKKTAPKDEYETQEQYETRQKEALSAAPAAVSKGMLCLVSRADDPKYDAETGTLWFDWFVNYKHIWFDGKDLHQSVMEWVSKRNEHHSSYEATNGFGAGTTVYKTVLSSTNIAFDFDSTKSAALDRGAEERNSTMVSFPIQLEPERAKALRGKVKLVVQYKVVPPYAAVYEDYDVPKFDSPFETKDTQSIVVAKAMEVAAIATETGEVLARFDLGSPFDEYGR